MRPPRDFYKKAHAGEIKGFTDIDDPYEAPKKAELVLFAADEVIEFLKNKEIIR